MTRRDFLTTTAATAAAGLLPVSAAAPTWPQFRGPERNGISTETGLLAAWPKDGPKLLWRANGLGAGYGSLAVTGGGIFVQGSVGSESRVMCLSLDGKMQWQRGLGRPLQNDRGNGPRATPTVVGDKLYAMAENGTLACLNAADGAPVWTKDVLKDYGGGNPNWLLSESPLVDGDKVVVTPGGSGAGVVALQRDTGKEVWRSHDLSDPAHYSSLLIVDAAGVRAYAGFTARAGVGVRASDGKLLWRHTTPANRTANCAMPVYAGGKILYSSAYGTGAACLKLMRDGDGVKAEEVYFTRSMMNHHGGMVVINGSLYGFSNAILTCLNFDTGEVRWQDRSVGKGCITAAGNHLYLLGEGNTMGLADVSPEGYRERGRFSIPDTGLPSWAYPVVCAGRLYIRNQEMLLCYDVRAGSV